LLLSALNSEPIPTAPTTVAALSVTSEGECAGVTVQDEAVVVQSTLDVPVIGRSVPADAVNVLVECTAVDTIRVTNAGESEGNAAVRNFIDPVPPSSSSSSSTTQPPNVATKRKPLVGRPDIDPSTATSKFH